MKKLKKGAMIVALVAPAIMSGCASTQPENGISNPEANTKMKPLDAYFKGFLFGECEKISFDNYRDVLEERRSGMYGNPFEGDCVPISFSRPEPEQFYSDIIGAAQDKERAQKIVDSLRAPLINEKDTNFDTLDDYNVQKIVLNDGRLAQIMKFTDEGWSDKYKSVIRDRDRVLADFDEYMFLHELFHMSLLNYDRSLPRNIRETMSDVGAVLVMSSTHQLTPEQSLSLAKDVYRAREQEAGYGGYGQPTIGSHYNPHVLRDMVGYFEENAESLTHVNSFEDAFEKSVDIALRMSNYSRNKFLAGSVYWTPDMKLPENVEMTASIDGMVVDTHTATTIKNKPQFGMAKLKGHNNCNDHEVSL